MFNLPRSLIAAFLRRRRDERPSTPCRGLDQRIAYTANTGLNFF
jgi:hypothetical protein